jgi:hypothetical protein
LWVVLILFISPSIHSAEPAAQQAEADNCTVFRLDEGNDELLTKQEKVEQMNGELFDSIDRYDACVPQIIAQAGSGGKGGNGGSGEEEGEEGEGAAGSEGVEGEAPDESENTASTDRRQRMLPVGSVPKDIPPADNDSVLEAQIRAAAMSEKDPKKQKKLWDQLRKYKTKK